MKIEDILSASTKLPFHIYLLWILWLSAGAFLLYYTLRNPSHMIKVDVADAEPSKPKPPVKVPSEPGPTPPPKRDWRPVPGSSVGGSPVWEGSRSTGTDQKGKSAEFEIYICSQEFTWKYRSSLVTELNEKNEDLLAHLRSPGLKRRLEEAKGIIVVGASSEEGSPEEEFHRAEERANRLVSWIREVVERKPEIYSLNIGKYQPEMFSSASSPELTKKQRAIIIISIIKTDTGVRIEEALYKALLAKDLPFDLKQFKQFVIRRHS